MLSNAELPKNFWAEALAYACYLVNRLPLSAIESKTPLEIWSKKAAQDYNLLRVFGCSACYYVKEDKLDPRAKKVVFVGFKRGIKGYKSGILRIGNLLSTEMSHSMRLQC